MNLSLEVRKFINSEQTGKYAEVILPAELPVDREELRAVRRDNIAAENAARAAAAVAAELAAAQNANKNAAKALEEACKEEMLAEERLTEKQKGEAEIQPEYDVKLSALNEAKGKHETVKAESDRLVSAYEEAERARIKAETSYSAANSVSAAKRAAYEAAKTAAENAAAGKNALTEKAEALRAAYAEAETMAEKADGEAKLAAEEEKAAADALERVTGRTIKLTGERKLLEKQLRDAEKTEAKLNRELNKLKSDYTAAVQQCGALKTRFESEQDAKKEKEALKLKLNAAQGRADAFETNIEEKQSQHDAAAEAAAKARVNFNECERRLAENTEQFNSARMEYDAAKQRTAKANEANTAEKAKFAGLAAAFADLTEQREKSAEHVSESKNAEQLASGEAAAAEAETERLKTVLESAQKDAEAKKTAAEQAASVTDSAEKEYTLKKAEFDSVNSARESIAAEKETAIMALAEKQERVKLLENDLANIAGDVERLGRETAEAEANAALLRESVHVIETKYEKARIHYMEGGKGEPIILIHSIGQSLYTFRKLFYKLKMRYRVIAIDLAGHGYSGRPDFFEYGIGDHAECIARFMDAIGVPSAHFLAFSMGCAYALELARLHPEKVEKLILLSPGGVTSETPLFVRMMESGLLGGVASRLYGLKSIRKLIDESLFDHTVIDDNDILEYYRPASDPDGRFAIRCSVGNYDEKELLASVCEISAETLIIWGTDDKLHGIETAENYNSALQNSNLIKALNAGHLIHEEKPDKIYALVKNFIPSGYGDEED